MSEVLIGKTLLRNGRGDRRTGIFPKFFAKVRFFSDSCKKKNA